MMNNPTVYGYCEAGCRRRVPTWEEHMELASYNSPLIAKYTLEPGKKTDGSGEYWTAADIKQRRTEDGVEKAGWIATWYTDNFNRTPIVGETFHCYVQVQSDKVSFHMTAEVKAVANEASPPHKEYVEFEAVELLPVTPLAPIKHIIFSNKRITDIDTESFTSAYLFSKFNRPPLEGETFSGFGVTELDNKPFHFYAQVTDIEDSVLPDHQGEKKAIFKLLYFSVVDNVENATNAQKALEADNATYADNAAYAEKAQNATNDDFGKSIRKTYVNREYMVQTLKNASIATSETATRKYNDDKAQVISWRFNTGKTISDALGISGVLKPIVINAVTDVAEVHFDALFTQDAEYTENGETVKIKIVEKPIHCLYKSDDDTIKEWQMFLRVELSVTSVQLELYTLGSSGSLNSQEIYSVPQINVFYK